VSAATVELRRCHGIEDFRACVALQKDVWNFSDAELVPLRMFVVADKVGGQVMGAFDGNVMSGLRCRSRACARDMSICTRTCWQFARTITTAASDAV
jgi:predicted GNAT superfamily acetyltransferase